MNADNFHLGDKVNEVNTSCNEVDKGTCSAPVVNIEFEIGVIG